MKKDDLEHRLTKTESEVAHMSEKISNIELQVTNHIPTSIKELSMKFELFCDKADTKYSSKWVEKGMSWTVKIIIGIVLAALVAAIIKSE